MRLAEFAALPFTREQVDLLAEVNSFNIAGRYPDTAMLLPTAVEARQYFAKIGELLAWLTRQL